MQVEAAKPGSELLCFYGPAQTNVETEEHHKNGNINVFLARRREGDTTSTRVGWAWLTGQLREPRFKARHNAFWAELVHTARFAGIICTPSASGASSRIRPLKPPTLPSQPVSNERALSVYPSPWWLVFCSNYSASDFGFTQCSI